MKYFYVFIILFFQLQLAAAQANFEIIITEIFADPTPSHGLPEKEYIELYNNSGMDINMEGYQLFYSSTDVSFPEYVIAPEEYIIVCRENNRILFETYGKTIGLSKFSLLNSGTTLRLLDDKGELVNEVTYKSEWYAEGREQGYSLEMIDVNYPCKEQGNWTSSLAEVGGTPGKSNASASSQPDVTPPYFVSFEEIEPTLFRFTFSEKLDISEEGLVVNADGLGIERVYFSSSDKSSVFVELDKPIEGETLYDLIFASVTDCSKNVSDAIHVTIGNIPSPEIGDLFLSELLFNPKTGGKDFVEVYNKSNRQLNLKGIGISRLNTAGDLEEADILFTGNQIIESSQFLCFTTDKNSLISIYPKAFKENVIEVQNLPPFNNDKGHVFLLSSSHDVLDSFEYEESMHNSSIDIRDGVSLERESFVDAESVWLSASSSEGYATPGYDNSNGTLSTNFQVIVSDDFQSANLSNSKDEVIINFLSLGGGNVTSKVYDVSGRLVKDLANNIYMKNALKISLGADFGKKELLPSGYYILYSEFRTSDALYQNKQKILLVQR